MGRRCCVSASLQRAAGLRRAWIGRERKAASQRRQSGACTGLRAYATTGAGKGSSTSSRRIAVVGGGLTGLTTAYFLAQTVPSTVRITLYEGSGRLGGWIRTDRVPVDVDGTRGVVSFERGPRTLSSLHRNTWRYDDLVLYKLALDLGLDVSTPADQPSHIYYPDRLVPLPPALPLLRLVREPLFLGCALAAPGYLLGRAMRDAGRPRDDYDPSVGEWLRRITMGRSVGDKMASAVIHGIYGGDIDRLSARVVLDRLFWAYHAPRPGKHASLMPERERALLDGLARDPRVGSLALRPKGALLHFGPAGMEALPVALADALRKRPNVDIRTHSPVRSLRYDETGQKVQIVAASRPGQPDSGAEAYDRVVSTLSSHDLARAAHGRLPSLEQSSAVSLMTVNMWYPGRELKPRGFGYLLPRAVPLAQNPERALGVFFDSDVGVVGPDEPAGTKLFVLMGGHYYDADDAHAVAPPASEAAAVAQARALLERHLGIPAATPCFAMARMARDCIPQHRVGHAALMARAHVELEAAFAGRLAVAGGSYTAIGAMAALRAGHDVAALAAAPDRYCTGLERFTEPERIVAVPNRDIPVRAGLATAP